MSRRLAWLLASLLTLAVLAVPGGAAEAETPAPGTILAAQRLMRFDTRTETSVLVASFRVQGYPGDRSDGLLQVGWVATSHFPHVKVVPAPCATAAATCADVWEVTLDGFAAGPIRSAGVQQARLTIHDSAGRQHRVELGDVVGQHLAPTATSVVSRPARVETSRREGRCARVRTAAHGLSPGAVRLSSGAGCHPRRPREGRARILLTVPAVVLPTTGSALVSTPTAVDLTHLRPRGRIRVQTLVRGLDSGWHRCAVPTVRRATTVVCGGFDTVSASDGVGPTLVRIGVARGARVDVTGVTRTIRYSHWVS